MESIFSIKVIGHQWYWSYEILDPVHLLNERFNDQSDKSYIKDVFEEVDNKIFSYDSYMLPDDAVKFKHERLLKVDNSLYLPVKTKVRFLITSADVLHSWAIPALGIKLDACPGRLNQTSTYIKRPGNFYGQCSEICGVNHGFMPISIVALDLFGEYVPNIDDENLLLLFNYFVKQKIN